MRVIAQLASLAEDLERWLGRTFHCRAASFAAGASLAMVAAKSSYCWHGRAFADAGDGRRRDDLEERSGCLGTVTRQLALRCCHLKVLVQTKKIRFSPTAFTMVFPPSWRKWPI